MNRRRFLAAATVSSSFLAGCGSGYSSETETSGSTPTPAATTAAPTFEVGPPEYPSNVSPQETFEIRTAIENTGSGAGSTTVALDLGDISRSTQLALDPGETTTVSFAVDRALTPDTYEFVIEETGTGQTVRGELEVGANVPELDHFIDTDGAQFVRGGEPFYVSGGNNDMVRRAPKWYVDMVFEAAADLGLNALRTWVYAGKCFIGSCAGNSNRVLPEPADDGSDATETLPPLNETVMRKLDYAIYKANETGVRLVLPLLSNTDSHTGSMDLVNYSKTASRHDEFYTDPTCREFYKEYVRRVLTRENVYTVREYRNDPGILLWELINEPDLMDNDGATSIMQDWIEEMATYVKTVDDNHLLSTGEIGYYEESNSQSLPGKSDQGMAFIENHEPDAIDAATFHMYLNQNGLLQETDGVPRWKPWVENHARDAHETLEKPVYAGEVAPSNDHGDFRVDRREADWKAQDEKRAEKYREIFDEFLDHDVNGALNWTFMIPFDYATDPVDDPEGWNAGVSVYPDDPHTTAVMREYASTLDSMSSEP